MIYGVNGTIQRLEQHRVVLSNRGMWYEINISNNTHVDLVGEKETMLYTHHSIREDDEQLYGFIEEVERSLFRLLIGVPKVGPGTAIKIYNSLHYDEITEAIALEDWPILCAAKGVGEKTAKAIIQKLKGKF